MLPQTVCVVVSDDVRELKKKYKAATEHVFMLFSFGHFFHWSTYDIHFYHQRAAAL